MQAEETPLRLCAITRVLRPLRDLIRFVAAPNGAIVPDLARKLPGRGVWITAEKPAIEAAVKGKVFSKSLKRQVAVPADLAETVERLLEKRVIAALALANKAGLVSTGFDKTDALIERGVATALMQAADAAEGGRQKLDRKFNAVQNAKGLAAPIVDCLTIEQMSLAMGRSNVVHAALIKGGATERLLAEAGRFERFRSRLGITNTARPAR